MSKLTFFFDLLPIEVIHQIFDYRSIIDILHEFSNINSYLDSAISTYDRCRINFQSCLKKNFDRICSRIQPDQIISLRLSNHDDTPDQVQLFFSLFNIKQFTSLRSITLINIENDLLLKFLDTLKCHQLRSLTIIPGYSSQKKFPKNALKNLSLYQLKRLVLNLDVWVSLDDIEKLLEHLSNLQHMELQIKGDLFDLCNGERWSKIVKHLSTFDFNFKAENEFTNSPHFLIDSFRSPFWLEEKRWFVAYDNHPSHVFTVPRFVTTFTYYSAFSSFLVPKYSTVSADQSLFHDHISNLMISNDLNEPILSHRFMHVKILSITNPILLDRLSVVIDLTQIHCLKPTDAISSDNLDRFIPNILPRVSELHLRTLPKGRRRQLNGINQIRTLHIQTVNSSSRLCRLFPCIERLHIGHVKSYRQIRFILNHLKSHLSFVSLTWPLDSQSQRSSRLVQNLLQRNREEFNFTYRSLNRRFSTVYLWISSNNEQSFRTAITGVWKWLSNGLSWV